MKYPLDITEQLLYGSSSSRVIFSEQAVQEAHILWVINMLYQTSYSTHAKTCLTFVSKCFQTVNSQSYIHAVQQQQLPFHVSVCHLSSENWHSAIQGCQRAVSYLLKKV